MRRLLAATVLLVIAALGGPAELPGAGLTQAAQTPVHFRQHGQRVKDLEWLLSGHKPNVYRRDVHPYRGAIDGVYGWHLRNSVWKAKYRLGYPMKDVVGYIAGKQFFETLTGKRQRPLDWIARASKRVHAAVAVRSKAGDQLIRRELAEVGVHEVPDGSNRGFRVDQYARVTGTVGLAWCAAFQQWALLHTYGHTIAGDSAVVFTIVAWGHRHSLVHALPRPGALVAFLRWQGHIGLVTHVTRSGFTTVEGNSSNGVRRHWYRTGDRGTVFIWIKPSSR